jgi:arylsulfatase A-like enzyme
MTGDTSGGRPNLLVVLTDQQRWDTLGAYGCPMDLTPNLDALAREGCTVEQAISPQPLCGPFRAAFQTGKYATETGVWRNSMPLPAEESTLADCVRAAGYEAGFVGNWHLAGTFDEPVGPERRGGYDDYWVGADIAEFTTQPTSGRLFDADGEPVTFDRYRADAFTDLALEAVETLSEPFLLVVSYVEPHNQNDQWTFVAPDGYADRHEKNPYVPSDLDGRPGDWYSELPDYYGMVERLDECVGRLLEGLDREGVREETVVAYASDHGCHFRTRPGEYKRTSHESAVRVPAVFAGPGFRERGDVDRVASLVDVVPTLLDAAGIDIPPAVHGESLLPAADGETADDADAFVQVSESQIGRALRTDRYKYAVAAPSRDGWRSGSGDQRSDVYVERYLYDLARDPHERVNLVSHPEYREVAQRLRDRLVERIATVEGDSPEVRQLEKGYRDY